VNDKCDRCPIEGSCWGQVDGYRYACAIRPRPKSFELWLGSDPTEEPAPIVDSGGDEEPPPVAGGAPAFAAAAPRLTLATTRSRLGLACFYGGKPSCGCSGLAHCHALGRDVSVRDCTACIQSMS